MYIKQKSKAVPETSCGGSQGCETLRLPHFLDSRLTDGVIFSLKSLPRYTPQEDSRLLLLLEAESTPGFMLCLKGLS
jgi:hypothetical protein